MIEQFFPTPHYAVDLSSLGPARHLPAVKEGLKAALQAAHQHGVMTGLAFGAIATLFLAFCFVFLVSVVAFARTRK